MERRAFLTTATAAATAGVAGCLGGGGNGNDAGNNTGNGNDTDNGNDTGNGNGTDPTPTAAAFSVNPQTPVAGEEVTLDASASTGDIESYEWTLPNSTATGETTTTTFDEVGEHEVTLTVTTASKSKNTTQTIAVIATRNPDSVRADFSISPSSPTPGTEVTLDASDSEGDIESYRWNLGNGRTASGKTTTVTYDEARGYEITLTVTSASGKTAETTKEATVSRNITIQVEGTPRPGQEVTFTVSGAIPNGTEYQWDFQNDGTVDTTTNNPSVAHTFEETGTQMVTVKLNRDGTTFAQQSREVSVKSQLESVLSILTDIASVVNTTDITANVSVVTEVQSQIDDARSAIETAEGTAESTGQTTVDLSTLRKVVDFQERLLRDFELTAKINKTVSEAFESVSVTQNVLEGKPQAIANAVREIEGINSKVQQLRSNRTGMEEIRQQIAGKVGREALSYTGNLSEYTIYSQEQLDGVTQAAELLRELFTALRQLSAGRAAFMNENWQEAANKFSSAENTVQSYTSLRENYSGSSVSEIFTAGISLPQSGGENIFSLHSEAATAATEGRIDAARSTFSEATSAFESAG
jgi:chitodextrinase